MHDHFHELRLRLVDCRANLRAAKDTYELDKAKATQRAAVTGKNAEERAVALILALADDVDYQTGLTQLRWAEHELERVEALLEAARDERRAAEWQIRAQLAASLMGTDIPSDGTDPYGDDAFDNTMQASADRRAVFVSDPYDHAMHVG